MKLKRRYIWWGLLGNLIQYGVPLSYIVWRYDIFKFEDAGKSVTGWGMVVIAIIYFIFQNKIKEFISDYDNKLGQVSKKGKWGFIFLTIAGFLALANLWIDGMLYFMLTLGGSNILSLIAYAPYYAKKAEYKELKSMIIQRKREEKIKSIA